MEFTRINELCQQTVNRQLKVDVELDNICVSTLNHHKLLDHNLVNMNTVRNYELSTGTVKTQLLN